MATSLFVVPRSMPRMVSMSGCLSGAGDANLGVAEQTPIPAITPAHFLDDLTGGPAASGHHVKHFHQLGIEGRANAGDRFQSLLPQGAFEALQAHCIACYDRGQHL